MGPAEIFSAFLRLGISHILLGLDHLMFLAGLLLVAKSWRSVVWLITSFTLAHSCTLALSTFGVISFPARWAEALIAASIVWVGLENILRRGEPRARWAVTFLFGLIHGFGFARALREAGLGATGHGVVWPLFAFNLGVEIGQIAVAALVTPLIFHLAQSPHYRGRWQPLLSGLIALAGLYWLVRRLAIGG